jgi:hypothetical protein
MFDYQSMVLLAFTRFHQRDTKGLQRCQDNLEHALEKVPNSRRLLRFTRVVRVFSLMLHKQVGAAVSEVRSLAAELGAPDFDLEAACNMSALVAQLTAAELKLDDAPLWMDTLALRFCTTRGLSELLARSAESHAPFAQRVRDGHQRITEMAEQSMAHTLAGDPAATVRSLIAQGQRTLNAKLLDMARMTLQRHHDKIIDAAELSATVEDLRGRYAGGPRAPVVGQDAGRQAGGVALRSATPTADMPAPPPGSDAPEPVPGAA